MHLKHSKTSNISLQKKLVLQNEKLQQVAKKQREHIAHLKKNVSRLEQELARFKGYSKHHSKRDICRVCRLKVDEDMEKEEGGKVAEKDKSRQEQSVPDATTPSQPADQSSVINPPSPAKNLSSSQILGHSLTTAKSHHLSKSQLPMKLLEKSQGNTRSFKAKHGNYESTVTSARGQPTEALQEQMRLENIINQVITESNQNLHSLKKENENQKATIKRYRQLINKNLAMEQQKICLKQSEADDKGETDKLKGVKTQEMHHDASGEQLSLDDSSIYRSHRSSSQKEGA